MRLKKNILPKHIFLFLLYQLLISITAICQERNNCEDEFNFIIQTYNNGDWSGAKNASINFINKMGDKDAVQVSQKKFKYPANCKNNIPLAYYYLIKSYLRLYNVDSAGAYYFKALKNEYKINVDTSDKKIFDDLGRLKKHSVDFYLGFISADYKEYQWGLRYGVTPKFFLDASFNHRHFNHVSYGGNGVFGKPILRDTTKFPDYSFNIQGYEAYVEMESYYKIPILPQSDADIFYVSPGVFVTYYLNSHVNTWTLNRYDSFGIEKNAILTAHNNQRYTEIDTFGVKMDLKQLYKSRINGGLVMNIGANINLKNRWQMFVGIKFAVGINNHYRNANFSSYRPGVDYFFLVLGAGKKFFKMKARKN